MPPRQPLNYRARNATYMRKISAVAREHGRDATDTALYGLLLDHWQDEAREDERETRIAYRFKCERNAH